MNRQSFCEILVKARESASCGKNELCRKTGFTFLQLQRIEAAYNNFKMILAFRYLDALNLCIYVGENEKIDNYETLYNWIVSQRKNHNITIAQLSEITSFSQSSISNVENKHQIITVDYFLAICQTFNYQISIH